MRKFLDELQFTPLADGQRFRLNSRFRFWSDVLKEMVEVPARFVTDLASIPRPLWSILPPWERYGPAAVLHDWLYWQQDCERDEADQVLREAMDVLSVDVVAVAKIYAGVRLGGQASWERNQALKASGYTKMASTEASPPYASAA